MTFNRDQVARIYEEYEEMERRISVMMSNGEIETVNELNGARALMREGIYAALMTTANNWEEIVQWLCELER